MRLDIGDRYLNTRYAKTLLRDNNVKKSIEIMKQFTTKSPIDDEQIDYIQDMGYEVECSYSYLRTKNYVKSFNLLSSLINHFNTFVEDQVNYLNF